MAAGVDPEPAHVGSAVNKVTLRHVFLRVPLFFPVSITQTTLHTHHLHVAITGKTDERSLGNFHTTMLLRKSGRIDRKLHSRTFFLRFSGQSTSWTVQGSNLGKSKKFFNDPKYPDRL
jgi:hypothetical protein